MTKIGFGWDDAFIFCGYFVNIGLCITSILIVYRGGVGRHIAEVERINPALMIGWAKGIFAVEVVYLTSVLFPKLSILFFYLRVFTSRTSIRIAYFTIGLVTVNWFVFVLTAFLQCRPFAFWWDRSIPGGKCINVQTFYRAMCVPNIITDLMVLALPVSSIVKLKLPVMKKFALLIIFLTASIGLIASIIRFTIFFQTEAFSDSTWSSVPLVGWSIVESGMYLIAACLPLLRPVFAKHTPEFIKSMYSSAIRSRNRTRDNNASNSQLELSASGGAKSAKSRSGFTKIDNSNKGLSGRTPSEGKGSVKLEAAHSKARSIDADLYPGFGLTGYVVESNSHLDTDSETGIMPPPEDGGNQGIMVTTAVRVMRFDGSKKV